MNEDVESSGRPIIGGRHGSPTITVAFPFSNLNQIDSDLREAVAELADLVARLAATNDAGRGEVHEAAADLAARIRDVA